MELRYRFLERPSGFNVEAHDRVPVSVTLTDTGFHVRFGSGPRQLRLFGNAGGDIGAGSCRGLESFCNLIQYRRLVQLVAQGSMSEWNPREHEFLSGRIKKWALDKTQRALGKRIHEQWRRLTNRAAPEILAVQKAVFSATLSDCHLLHEPPLYRAQQLVSDIQRYRAAASLPPIALGLIRRAEGPDEYGYDSCEPAEIVAQMSDWQRLYSCFGQSYRSLRRTLMNLPGGIPARLLFYLSQMELERPLTDRVELLALLACRAEQRDDQPAALASRLRIFMHATRAEIRSAMTKLSRYLGDPLSHRRASDICQLAQFVGDYPEEHRGKLSGLLSRAIRWHNTVDQTDYEQLADELGHDTETDPPPIPLPENSELKFLTTVGAVIEEGRRMQHCIATYAQRAVRGDCFLFHYESAGDHASFEVDRVGNVRQSHGPRNSVNRAVSHGRQLLQAWAIGLRPTHVTRTGIAR